MASLRVTLNVAYVVLSGILMNNVINKHGLEGGVLWVAIFIYCCSMLHLSLRDYAKEMKSE